MNSGEELHSVLKRQLKRLHVTADERPSLDEWQQVLAHVDQAYQQADRDRYTLERSLNISSEEMQSLYDALKKTSDHELARERDKLQTIITAMGDGLLVIEGDGTCSYLNPEAERLLGYSAAEVAGRPVVESLDPSNLRAGASSLANAVQRSLTGGETTRNADAEFVTASGYWLPVSYVLNPVLGDRQEHSCVLVFQDIGAHKEAQAVLENARRSAEDANRAKSGFLANVSHELRTPLHGILSFASLGLTKIDAGNIEPLEKYLRHIHSSGERLLTLVTGLLDIAKLESGKTEFNFQPVDIYSLVLAVVGELEFRFNERGLKISLQGPDRRIHLPGDDFKLKQVVTNLLSNAAKFTPAGGSISVAVAIREHVAMISVQDEGPGVPEGEREAIFKKFVQSSTTDAASGGTGLGLAISHEIVLGHRGRIWVENVPDGGALFQVGLPLRHSANPVKVVS